MSRRGPPVSEHQPDEANEAGVARAPAGGDKDPVRAYHPFLVSLFFVTSLYSVNLDDTPWRDVPVCLAAVTVVACVVTALARVVFAPRLRAALAATFLLAMWFSYTHLFRLIMATLVAWGMPLGRHRYVMAIWALTVLAGILVLRFGRFNDALLNRWLNAVSAMLIVVTLVPIGISLVAGAAIPGADATDAERIALDVAGKPTPDIYFLVFDRYADAQTLEDCFDFDNSPFIDALEERGFWTDRRCRANYPKTVFSLTSTLNMRYVRTDDPNVKNGAVLRKGHEVARALRGAGYDYYHLGNWSGPLRANRLATYNRPVSPLPSEFATALYDLTPLTKLAPIKGTRSGIIGSLDAIGAVAAEPGPKFVFAHVLLPHRPFVFDRDGAPVTWMESSLRTYEENYVNQLVFTNRKILAAIDAILAQAGQNPIIILQADEGPCLSEADSDKDLPSQIRRRTGVLAAYRFPGVDVPAAVSPTRSLVNTFRIVLREQFDADVELLEDRFFYWESPVPTGNGVETSWGSLREITDEVSIEGRGLP